MTRPVFFSMGGPKDAEFAKTVKDLLPDNMAYFYKRTGVEGANFQVEIESELQACRLLVVFWSDDYLKSEAAKLELAFFRKLVEGLGKTDKELLIVPVKRTGPNIGSKWTNPITNIKDEFVLGKWRLERSLDPAPDAQKVADHILRKMEHSNLSGRVLVPRPSVVEDIKRAVSMPGYRAHEFVFVAGYEGNGRRTALRQYMGSSYGNLTERSVAFDSGEGPEDLLLRMLEISGVSAKSREEIMARISQGNTTAIKELRKIVHDARAAKSYFVLTLDKFAAVDAVGMPHWVADAFGGFGPGNAPLVFLVTSNPVTDALMAHYPNAGRVRIPGLDENEIGELVYRLSLEDRNAQRWTQEDRKKVCSLSGSSPSLCQTIMYSVLSGDSMDFLDEIAKREEETFSANMTVLLSHIIGKFEHRRNEVLALKVIERLGLTSRQALDEIIAPFVGHMSYNLYELLEYGLVERLSDDVYRIPPLIQRRLGYLLLHKVQDSSLDEMFNQFARKMTIANDNYGTVYASNKLAVGLRSGEEIPELATYLTTAMLFKVGIERYSSEDYTKAHSVLGRAMEKLDQKSAIDVGTQVEIVRYFGLAAARVPNMTHDVRRACAYLEHDLANTPRAKQAKAISAFLKGFDLSRRKDAESAIPEFEESRHLLTGVRNAERQRGAILTELSRAYLLKHPPDYDKAVRAAEEAYREKDTVHNLGGLIRAKTFRLLDNRYTLRPTFDSEVATIRELLKRLDDLCRRTGNDFYLVRLADLERVIVLRDCEDNATSPDLSVPISLTTKALTLSHRHQAREQRWAFCLMDSSDDHSKLLLSETSEVIASPKTFLPTQVSKAVKVKAIVLARTSQGEANEFVARHRSSIHDKTKDYLGKVIRNNGVLSATNQSFIEVSRT